MGKSYVRIIQAIALAAAILGLLLSTPSLEARTRKKSHHKKVKIVFDGSAPASSSGELGDEIVQPRASNRHLVGSNDVVHMRGGSVDDLFRKSKRQESQDDLDNPDLIDPAVINSGTREQATRTVAKPTTIATDLTADESALGSFKKSPKMKKPEAARVRVTVQPLPEPIMEFEEVKRPTRMAQRPRPSSNALATRVASNDGPSHFKFNFALENTTSMGRKYELEMAGGRNYTMKNEVFVGTQHSSGWGAKIAANYLATSNDDAKKDIREMGDPSIMIVNPSIFKSIDINVYGYARYYLPVSTDSKQKGLQHFAYNLIADVNLVESLQLHNELTPRYFLQSFYADNDAFSLLQDMTELSRRFDWVRVGVGQRTQIESHQAVSPGTSVELYPFADLLAISNTILEAKFYIPVIASGLVNGAPGSPAGPTGTGFSNLQFEFSGRISF